MIVNPAPGALVRDPVTSLVIVDGAEVDPNEPYWARLLADGDIVEAEPTAPGAAPAAPVEDPAHAAPFSSDEDAA